MKSALFNINIRDLTKIKPSATMVISEKVRALKREGKDVIHFGIGDPNFNTPDHIKQAAMSALNQNFTHYTDGRGLLELRQAIAEKLLKENNIEADPATEIIVTPGAKHAIFCAILALIEVGDEVMYPIPGYVSYEPIIRIAGGTPVPVPLRKEEGFSLGEELLDDYYSPKTKLLLINSPHNPTGKVFSKQQMETIASWVKKKNIYVITDEIYEKIIFDKDKHHSIASLPGMKEHTVTVNGFSKSFAMTGWRLGYLAGPKYLVDNILKVHQHCATSVCTFVQKAGIAALTGPQEPIREMASEYEKKRNFIAKELSEIGGISFISPQGSFYVFPDISFSGLSSLEFAKRLLDEASVAVTPGIGFGDLYDDFVRLAFTRSMSEIREALKRMSTFLSKL